MRFLKGRPLATVLTVFITFFAAFLLANDGISCLLALGLFVLFAFSATLFWIWRRRESCKRILVVFACAVIAALGAIGYGSWFKGEKLLTAIPYQDGNAHDAFGVVEEILYEKPFGSAYVVSVEELDEKQMNFKTTLAMPFCGDLVTGDEIRFPAVFSENDPLYADYQRSRGILSAAEAESVSFVSHRQESVFERASYVSDALAENLYHTIGKVESDEAAGFAVALLLGRRDALEAHVRLDFSRVGISHILALSGLHLSVLIGALDFALRAITLSRRKKDVLLMLVTLILAWIGGFSASIMRASIMLILFYFSDFVGERNDSLTALFVAVFLILVFHPWSVFDAGLWFSFAATLGILVTEPIRGEKREGRKFLRTAGSLVMMTLSAVVFTLPLSWIFYGGVSWISPLSNLLILPIVHILLYLLLLLSLFFFVPGLSWLLAWLCGKLIVSVERVAAYLSDIKGIYLSLRYPFVPYLLLALGIGMFLLFSLPRLRKRNMTALFLAFCIAFGVSVGIFRAQDGENIHVCAMSDGKSDLMVVRYAGKTIVVDATTGGRALPMRAISELEEECVTDIDLLVLTHLHSYHAATLERLAGSLKIHQILLPESENEAEMRVMEAVQRSLSDQCELLFYRRNGESRVSCGHVTLWLPGDAYLRRSSHPILSLALTDARTDALSLFYVSAAGMEREEIREMVSRAHVVWLGSHGPEEKNIYDPAVFSGVEAVIFSEKDSAFWTEFPDSLPMEFLEEHNGIFHIEIE